jgi:AAHS family 4-hydroxybenzoate transporter-like MFS transporter
LSRHPQEFPRLAEILNRITGSQQFDGTEDFTDTQEEVTSEGLSALFNREYFSETSLFCLAFFTNLFAFYMFTLWLPSFLAKTGMSQSDASQGAAFLNLGGVIGALLVGFWLSRFGSRKLMGLLSLGGVLSSLFLIAILNFSNNAALLLFGITLAGFFINGSGPSLFALGSYIYPTQLRATGVGAGLFMGRIGGILSSFVGAAVLGMQNFANVYFGLIALTSVICFAALMLIKKHIPKV